MADQDILLVEDDKILLDCLKRLLSTQGFQVFAEMEDSAAKNVLVDHGESLVCLVTDVTLGTGKQGLALAQWTRQHFPALPILLMSGSTEHLSPELHANVTFIQKPFSTQQLVKAIRETARGAR